MEFTCLKIEIHAKVAEIILNRPQKANALNETLWFEIGKAFRWADETAEVRAVILRSEGPHFTAGIDFEFVFSIGQRFSGMTEGHRQDALRAYIRSLQDAFSMAEACRKPVLAALQGSCFGGGIDLVTACDIRYASREASFCVKEVDLSIVADIGTLQRLPRLIGEGRARELALTARIFDSEEAQAMGLVNRVFDTPENMLAYTRDQAQNMAQKSPLAMRGTKQILNYSRDHSIAEGLDYVATWNAGMLLSEDLKRSMEALRSKKQPEFPD
jgi:enoyl-CoA hydratase